MAFQSTVNFRFTTGFIGEAQADVPSKARPWRLTSQTAIANTVGKAFTYSSDNVPSQGNQGVMLAVVGGAGVYAGILIHPKHYPNFGTTAGGPLAPSLDVQPNSEVELMTMGNVIVYLPAAATYGDLVYFVQATGALGTGTAGAGQTQIPGAKVLTTIGAAGPAVISLDE